MSLDTIIKDLNNKILELSPVIATKFNLEENKVNKVIQDWLKGSVKETNVKEIKSELKTKLVEMLDDNFIHDLENELETLTNEEIKEKAVSEKLKEGLKEATKAEKYYCVNTKKLINKSSVTEKKYAFYSDSRLAGIPDSEELNNALKQLDITDEPDAPKEVKKKTEASPKKTKSAKSKTTKSAKSK